MQNTFIAVPHFVNVTPASFPFRIFPQPPAQAYAVVHSEMPLSCSPRKAPIATGENPCNAHPAVRKPLAHSAIFAEQRSLPRLPELPPPAVPVHPRQPEGLSDNAAAAIAYLTIIPSILFLVLDPYKRIPLVRFHSIQNLALAVAWVVFWIAMVVLHTIFHIIPFVWLVFMLVEMVAGIAFFIAWLIALIKASKGEFFKLPFIGEFAAKQASV